jgi:hypothetical protein
LHNGQTFWFLRRFQIVDLVLQRILTDVIFDKSFEGIIEVGSVFVSTCD